jgi:hypothetical protein
MSTSGNFFTEPESISRQTSTRSKLVSKTGTLERFFYNNQQSLSEEEEEGSEEETESEGNENKESDNQVEENDSQVENKLTEGLEGLHLREETEPEEETKSDETDDTEMSANQGTEQAVGSQVLVPTNVQGTKSLVPGPRFFDGD